MNALERLQNFFEDLFMLDLADLDFGIYRLYNLKQEEIKKFITQQLPQQVDEAFAEVTSENRKEAEQKLNKLTKQVKETFGDTAVTDNGEIVAQFKDTPLGKKYIEAKKSLENISIAEGNKVEVFNHLVNFFSRYYEDGDFIPKRRYGAREAYAVPYSGEEVFFHWANRDQHYVKTSEQFKDYAFKVDGLTGQYRVRFIITEASVPRDNTKGKHRYFFPQSELAEYNPDRREFVLPFEYRLPTPEEVELYGKNSKAQKAILNTTYKAILDSVPEMGLQLLLTKRDGEEEQAVLLRRMRHFCRRNTSDYFIHKNLQGFLQRELEFFVKDQVLHIMDIEGDLDAKRRIIRVFRQLAEQVIEFLATVEDVQKTLFEKRKFVLATDYLIPIQHVPQEFWPEILDNQAQLDEWQQWGMLDPEADLLNQTGEVNNDFLEKRPTLPVHTRHFSPEFTRRLLEALPFEDLDDATDGVLVHGENYQALNLLMARYWGQVKCVYIDPPYNTGSGEFIYRDGYQHASWLSMLDNRAKAVQSLLKSDATIFTSIDDNEQAHLRKLYENIFGAENFVANIIWQKKYTRANDARWFSDNHDYLIVFAKNKKEVRFVLLPRTKQQEAAYGNPDNDPRGPWKPTPLHAKSGSGSNFTYTFKNGESWSPPPGTFPRYSPATLARLDENNEIWFGPDGKLTPQRKSFLSNVKKGVVPVTIWPYQEAGHNHEAINELKVLFPKNPFSNPKPTRLIRRVVFLTGGSLVLDYFAGSGTTGHAVISLNREDGGRRKFILVEMGEYFDSVLLPRIAKVMFTPEWKEGKPKRLATQEEARRTPRIVKIIRLESYDDALHNMVSPTALERAAMAEETYKEIEGEDAFRLRYWVTLPLDRSETMLRALELRYPFDYSLEMLTDDGPQRKSVDLVETFNYLYGLRVRRYETWRNPGDGERQYLVIKAMDRDNRRNILVIWRNMKNLTPEVERVFLEEKLRETENAGEIWDEILINGDTPTPGVISLDPKFKELMMAGELA